MQITKIQASQVSQNRNDTIDSLNELLGIIYEAEQVYQGAIKDSTDSRLTDYFIGQAASRNTSASQLQKIILKHGGTPFSRSSTTATAHRVWMDFITLFTGKKDQMILEDCLHVDRSLLKKYQEVLSSNYLLGASRVLIERQFLAIQGTVTTFRSLDDVI